LRVLTLLKRYTGATDLAVGSPLAGRSRTDLEGLVGLFVNHVVFRASAEDDRSSRNSQLECAKRSGKRSPIRRSLRKCAEERPPFGDPFAESFYLVNFICQREYARASTFVFEFAGIRMSTMPSKSQGALYDLNFFMVEREAGWRLSLE